MTYVLIAGCVFALLAALLLAMAPWWVAGAAVVMSQAWGVALAPRVGRALALASAGAGRVHR